MLYYLNIRVKCLSYRVMINYETNVVRGINKLVGISEGGILL
jgi:hypothetical protein